MARLIGDEFSEKTLDMDFDNHELIMSSTDGAGDKKILAIPATIQDLKGMLKRLSKTLDAQRKKQGHLRQVGQ